MNHAELLGLLKRLEWSGQVGCPLCEGLAGTDFTSAWAGRRITRDGSHEANCEISAAIKSLKSERPNA